MNHRIFNLLIPFLTLFALAAHSQTEEGRRRLEEFRRIVNSPVVLQEKGLYAVKAINDISYTAAKESHRKLDIYQPEGKGSERFPLVILIHGKTPVETDPRKWNGYVTWSNLVAGRGFVTMMFTHSLAIPGNPLETGGKDLADVVRYAKLNHAKYNIDTTRIALVGYSAGAVLLSEAFNKTISPRCLVAFYGLMDLSHTPVLFKGEDSNTLQKFSLVSHMTDSNFPPVFVARAGKENNPELNPTIDTFLQKANALNLPVTFINHPAGVHGFDTLTDDARSREIVSAVLAFLQNHLR